MTNKHNPFESTPLEQKPEPEPVAETAHSATQEEFDAGKTVNSAWEDRAKAEQDAGRKLVEHNEARAKKPNPESKSEE